VSFTYDRLWERKLSQVYHLLIPAKGPVVLPEQNSDKVTQQISVYENSSDIYESILGPAEGQ
jgi:hypothetical protein